MSQLDEIAAKLEASFGRLEDAVDVRLRQDASHFSADEELAVKNSHELEVIRQERDQLYEENSLLKQDAAGLTQRLTSALQRLDRVLADS